MNLINYLNYFIILFIILLHYYIIFYYSAFQKCFEEILSQLKGRVEERQGLRISRARRVLPD